MTPDLRINKYLADKGIASRREADRLIKSGKVYVNGQKAIIGQKVGESDKVTIKRFTKLQIKKERQYLLFNKPKGIVTVNAKEGEKEIKDIVRLKKGVVPIGRLDKNSSGLILLTNDGRTTKKLLSPSSNVDKEYLVSVNKTLRPSTIKALEKGIALEDGQITKPAKAKKLSSKTLSLTIQEGKRHQIRRMLAALGFEVKKLKRIRIASLNIRNINEGELKTLSSIQKKEFLKSLALD